MMTADEKVDALYELIGLGEAGQMTEWEIRFVVSVHRLSLYDSLTGVQRDKVDQIYKRVLGEEGKDEN